MIQLVKNLPAMKEIPVRFLGCEDPLDRGKATHSSFLAWRIYSPWVRKESDMTERISLSLSTVEWYGLWDLLSNTLRKKEE